MQYYSFSSSRAVYQFYLRNYRNANCFEHVGLLQCDSYKFRWLDN